MKTRTIVFTIIGFIVMVFLIWKALLCWGIIRSVPEEWIDYYYYYNSCSSPNRPHKPEVPLKCPLCNGQLCIRYASMVEQYRPELDDEGRKLWIWRGCLGSEATWVCRKCGKGFDGNGKAITCVSRIINTQ